MTQNLLLSWLPIVLASGVGARLLGSRKGIVLGGVCAMFWIALASAGRDFSPWHGAWGIAMLLAGSLTIVLVGTWAGQGADADAGAGPARHGAGGHSDPRASTRRETAPVFPSATVPGLREVSAAIEQFDDWLESHRHDSDPWPEFGEFLRGTLYQLCQATHVKLYRILSEGDELVPIREADPFDDREWRSARVGLVGHVATSGRTFVAGRAEQGELVDRLADESSEPLAWAFAITSGARRIGVVTAGQFTGSAVEHPELLRVAERLACQFWTGLGEACRSRSARTRDPVSGLLVRESFFTAADQSLQDAYHQGEPAVVAVIALEQLRHLNDNGQWERVDEIIRDVSALLRLKVRSDDHLGRFDGTRFLLFLRRVDSNLAMLILEQLMSRLTVMCGDPSRWGLSVQVRCGVSGSGTERPPLTSMVAQAMRMCQQARINEVNIASDLGTPQPVGAGDADAPEEDASI